MPVLKYLADRNTINDYFRPGNPVKEWFASHRGEIGISTLTLAEMRRGIELKGDTKARLALERIFDLDWLPCLVRRVYGLITLKNIDMFVLVIGTMAGLLAVTSVQAAPLPITGDA
jgi:predicted nucleic acid-binding protein